MLWAKPQPERCLDWASDSKSDVYIEMIELCKSRYRVSTYVISTVIHTNIHTPATRKTAHMPLVYELERNRKALIKLSASLDELGANCDDVTHVPTFRSNLSLSRSSEFFQSDSSKDSSPL